jgi:hypothetical protein
MGAHSANETTARGREFSSSRRGAIRECPGPGWKMDSTACLVRLDASHVKLAFQPSTVGQSDVEQDHPISRHLKFDVSLVAARFCFFRICEAGTHPRMRHIRLDRDPRPGDWFGGATGQLESDGCYTHSRRFRGNFVLNRNPGWRLDPLGTASDE